MNCYTKNEFGFMTHMEYEGCGCNERSWVTAAGASVFTEG